MLSPSGWPEVPCARCGKRVTGIQWGDLCPSCSADNLRRANRLASRISLAATLLVGLYVYFRMPEYPLARIYAIVAVLVTSIVTRRIVQRVALAVFAERPKAKEK